MTAHALSQKARTQMVLRALLAPVLLIGQLFLTAGTWHYWQAWVYFFVNMVILVLMGTVLTPHSELMEERLNPKEGMKGWDKFYFAVTTPLYVIALVLGSWYASIPQVIAAFMLIWRTAREDRTLQAELPGYAEFAKETKYRLVPGVW
jgi:hypothetical protein